MKQLDKLVQELCNLPTETPWVEFKHNNYDADMIGRDISALANGAAWKEKSYAYMVWGIDDESHHIVGTDYNLQTMKKGDQELEIGFEVCYQIMPFSSFIVPCVRGNL
ncbi:helix-turn-helix domain-containing protein [uncultured Megasphaera sp.]|uniref:AlbA family DNA-binding domain-containing protein n=1 Tax=uncultured Megasphaera sp. TaxID=165188 RepID=UPI0025E62DED|nr:RNA-binding domain-containing protein [uncultured Megasphaera sp.]